MLIAEGLHQRTRMDIIVNASAGVDDAHIVRQQLAALLASVDIDARLLVASNGAELRELARQAVRGGAQTVVAGGGDGTVSTIAALVAGTGKTLGILPLGTLNHFAKDLCIPLDLAGAVRNLAAGHAVNIDVGDVNGDIFINNASLGIYPKLVRMRERKQQQGLGKWPAFLLAFFAVMRRYPLVAVRLVAHDQELVRRTPFVFIGNNEYETSSFRMGARGCLTAGKLSIYTAPVTGRFELFKLFIKALLGKINDLDNFDSLCATEVWVQAGRRTIRIALDGEVKRLKTPLHFRVRPKALNVIVPAGQGIACQ